MPRRRLTSTVGTVASAPLVVVVVAVVLAPLQAVFTQVESMVLELL